MATNYLAELRNKGFAGSPGYKFALDQGQQAVSRRMGRGSGNVLAALNEHAIGTAQQDYGNEFQRALAADSLSQQGDLATQRLALDRTLGEGQLGLGRDRLGLDRTLGEGQLALGQNRLGLDRDEFGLRRTTADREYGLGVGRLGLETELGRGRLDNDAQSSWYNYDLGKGRLGLDEAEMGNRFTLGRDAAARGWYDSQTQRGNARSTDLARRTQNRTGWY